MNRVSAVSTFAAILSVCAPSAAWSTVIGIEQEGFGADSRLVDFDNMDCGFTERDPIPGVSITNGNLPEPTNRLKIIGSSPGVPGCSYWGEPDNPGVNSVFVETFLTFEFDAPIERIGFVWGSNVSQSREFLLTDIEGVTSVLALTSLPGPPDGVNNWIFHGFESNVPIVRATFLVPDEGGAGIYDLLLEVATPVPAPSVALLLSLGLLGFCRRPSLSA